MDTRCTDTRCTDTRCKDTRCKEVLEVPEMPSAAADLVELLSTDAAAGSVAETRERIIDACLRVVSRYGVSKTTVDDVAAEAGCSRATVYRYFASREALSAAAMRREASRAMRELDRKLGDAESLQDVVVALFTDAAAIFRAHPVLQAELAIEPQVTLGTLVGPESPVPEIAAELLVPYVKEHAGDHPLAERAPRRFADWVVRVGLIYLINPTPYVDFDDAASTREFVTSHVFANCK